MKKSKLRKIRSILYSVIIFFIIILFFSLIENRFVPTLKEISHMKCKTTANEIIDTSVQKILKEMEITPLFCFSDENNGYIANTALVNQLCSEFSAEITNQMASLQKENIRIPFGAVTGWSYFANLGPEIPFTLVPMGTVKVDYTSDFLSAGINQINYKIWVDISMEMKIVNPLYQEILSLERKIMLVDIVFSGKVPEHYFQFTPQNEYLLTE